MECRYLGGASVGEHKLHAQKGLSSAVSDKMVTGLGATRAGPSIDDVLSVM